VRTPQLFISNTLHWIGQSLNLVRFWWLVIPVLILIWFVREKNIIIPTLAILPPLVVVAASAAHVYPYGEVRLMIFCFPALFLLVAQSLTGAARRVPLLLLLAAPFVFSGLARDTYNATYMKTYDLRPMFEMIARSHVPGDAIYAEPSFAAPLRYENPVLSADIHNEIPKPITNVGWYVGRVATLGDHGGDTSLRIGDTIAVRKTAACR
jgi:hypothetical protein